MLNKIRNSIRLNRKQSPAKNNRVLGIEMPPEFPIEYYESIHRKVTTKKDELPETWSQYACAWNGLAYRYLSCNEHHKTFTSSVEKHGETPKQPERYIQERELFGFFITGLAIVEGNYLLDKTRRS